MSDYNFQKIEPKWQQAWRSQKLFHASDKGKKYYYLIEFPYPSSDGLHVGHPRSYTAIDIMARKKRMEGFDVLFPIGFDAFGLPTENYAIKMKRKPQDITKENIAHFRQQLQSLGLSFDWEREVTTSDPSYYRWTQWLFLQFYNAGLVYQAEIPINWCPQDKIGLANEEVVDGKCERCGTPVTRRNMKQWLFRITTYAQRLIDDLETVDYLDKIKTQQINWIGRSEGAEIRFDVANTKKEITVFTTRPDTIFGATYMVVAPEHQLVDRLRDQITNWSAVEKYRTQAASKSDMERTELAKVKTGVELKGVKAINPMTKEEIPVWVADYVLASYGTGAIMAVPAHDERDYEFAQKFKLPIRQVIENQKQKTLFGIDGKMINSGMYNGLRSQEMKKRITKDFERMKIGTGAVQYKLRDWVFSRQHYWGEPIPLIHCEKCGVQPVPEKDLPVVLPEVEHYEPTDTGESPLAAISDWVNVKCPNCDGPAKRETDTMPNWAGSSWYFIRYADPHNAKKFADIKKIKHWLPVDLYNGGMEHTVLHLLYSRFWYKALYDLKLVPTPEPYLRRVSQGLILAEDGQKMSKSRGNVINPDDIVREYGADTLRMYIMFIGPYSEHAIWSTSGIFGVKRFLERVWNHYQKPEVQDAPQEVTTLLHKTIKKVSDDIETLHFNTAVSAFMILLNAFEKHGSTKADRELFLKMLTPFAPHIAEELWQQLGHQKSVHHEAWPVANKKFLQDATVSFIIQVNGKLRARLDLPAGIGESEAQAQALTQDNVKKFVPDKPKKVIFVKDKLINFVI